MGSAAGKDLDAVSFVDLRRLLFVIRILSTGGRMTQARVEQIPALTGIRILAALGVVVGHFDKILYGLFPEARVVAPLVEGGYLGVEMFFILSGFIISHNYAYRFQHLTKSTFFSFLRNRFARLYPVHLFTLGLVVLLVVAASMAHVTLNSEGKYDLLSFFMNVALLQSVPPAWSWNGPAWSISAEAGAYLAFPLLALAVCRVRTWRMATLIAGTSLLATIAALYLVASLSEFSAISYPSMWIRIAGEFTAGCFLWRAWSISGVRGYFYDYLAVAGSLGVLAVLFVTPTENVANFLALPLIAICIFSCASAVGPVRRFLSLRVMDYGGRISYSVYMVHVLVLMVGGKVLPWEEFADGHWALRLGVLASYFLVTFIGAALTYRFVEEPWRKRIGAGKSPIRKSLDSRYAVSTASRPR